MTPGPLSPLYLPLSVMLATQLGDLDTGLYQFVYRMLR